MNGYIKNYINKSIKVHMGPEWNYFGKLTNVDEENDTALLTTESAEIAVKISQIMVITHVPNAERFRPPLIESDYHPLHTNSYRR